MALPTRLTEKQIADLPWLNGTNNTPPKIDVTGHNGNDIARFRNALSTSKIPTKEVVKDGMTYVEVATDVPGVRQHLDSIRLKHLPLVDANGLAVRFIMRLDASIPLARADAMFADLRPSAAAGVRAENPAALESLQKVFHRYGYYRIQIQDGTLKVLASESNAQLLKEVGAIKDPFKYIAAETVKLGDTSVESATLANFMRSNALPLGIGAAIVTANSAYAAAPALRNGEYAEASLIAANTGIRTATELALATECTAKVATAAAPLAPSGLGYAATVIAGATACAVGTHEIIKHGDAAMALIKQRVEEVAANNGLDPDRIWGSMLDKMQNASPKNIDAEPAQER